MKKLDSRIIDYDFEGVRFKDFITIHFKNHDEFVEAYTWIMKNISDPYPVPDSGLLGGLGMAGPGWKLKYPNRFYIEDEEKRTFFILKFGKK